MMSVPARIPIFSEREYNSSDKNNFGPLTYSQGADKSIPDFTVLFENAFLTIGPLGLALLLLCAQTVATIWRRPDRKVMGVGGLVWFKRILYALLVIINLVYLIVIVELSVNNSILISKLSIAAAAISLSCSIMITLTSTLYQIYSVASSNLVQISLGVWILTDMVTIRTSWLSDQNRVPAALGLAGVVLKATLLLTEELPKKKSLRSPYSTYPPEVRSGIYSKIFLIWLNPLMLRGLLGAPLKLQDLWACDTELSAEVLTARLHHLWSQQLHPSTPEKSSRRRKNIFFVLAWEFKWLCFSPMPTRVLQAGFIFAQPFLIQRTLEWYGGSLDAKSWDVGYGILGAYAVVYIGIAATTAFGQYQVLRFITAIRGSLVLLIYRKTLELECSPDNMTPITLMSTDVERIVQGLQFVHETILSFFTFSIAMWLLERQLGVGAIAPIVVAVSTTIVIGSFSGQIDRAQKRWVEAVEKRVAVTTQVLTSMESIKMSGLDGYVSSVLQLLRTTELNVSLAMRRFITVAVGLSFMTPNFSPVLGFAVYILQARRDGRTLLASQAFSTLAVFNLLSEPLNVLIQTLPALVSAYACFTRIGDFLRKDSRQDMRDCIVSAETSDGTSSNLSSPSEKIVSSISSLGPNIDDNLLSIENGTFSHTTTGPSVLTSINLHVRYNTLTILTGPSGSGKTTLLEAILGELSTQSRSIHFDSRFNTAAEIAYCSQRSWLRNESVKRNILNGAPFEEAWWKKVVWASGLEGEIEELCGSEAVGHGAGAISGGQKQRIALARAVYSRRKLVLLDETLSGLDSLSEEKIVERLLGPQGLFRVQGITVILATHSAKHFDLADQVIILTPEGTILEQTSTPETLDISQLSSDSTPKSSNPETIIPNSANPFAFSLATRNETTSLEDIRDMRKGEMDAYRYYFASLGPWKLYIAVCLVIGFVFFTLFPQIWLQWWTASNVDRPNNRLGYWISIYAVYGLLAILSLTFGCWLLICDMVKHSAEWLHTKLVKTIECAPISIFTTIDPGLMVNRFSQDMSLVDMELPLAFANTLISLISILAQMILIAISSRYLGAAIPFVLLVCIITQRLYIRTSRQLRFLDLEAKGPLYTQFIETLNGLHTLRAFNLQSTLSTELSLLLDASQKPFYLLLCAQRWLGLVLNLTNMGLALLLIGVAIATRVRFHASGFLGVALINIMTFGNSLATFINVWATLETSLAAIERVKHFSEETPSEVTEEPIQVPDSWPEKGGIEIRDLCIAYPDQTGSLQKLALKNVSLSITPGTKIVICGKSGSGKTTLCKSLLRMTAYTSGSIYIDSQSLSHIPHQDLRTALSVVPQEPAILPASIRLNIDPYSTHTDAEVEMILRKVGLWEKVKDTYGTEEEINVKEFSFGQKQLLCLARALVKGRRILVLDESTSSVDAATDRSIHKLVCEDLEDITIISVMHRLENVELYDMVAVLEEGRLVEFGRPKELLSDPASAFSGLYLNGTDN